MNDAQAGRVARQLRILMCPPEHFEVVYSINPWMDPSDAVDSELAYEQWDRLRQTYLSLGHIVDLIEPVPGCPDMVFTANGATVAGSVAMGVRFRFPQRAPEEAAFLGWLQTNGFPDAGMPDLINEGQGDILPAGGRLLAGFGFRTESGAHAEVATRLGIEVTSLELVDPHFYHLDTAMTILAENVAYLPQAFSPQSRRVLAELFPDAFLVNARQASVFGLNALCDGRHIVMTDEAPDLADRYRQAGFEPITLNFSEFRKSGGGIKCASLVVG